MRSLVSFVILCLLTISVHFVVPKPLGIDSEGVDLRFMDSKMEKILDLISNLQYKFKWERSILTEMAQTQSFILREIRNQEKGYL